MDVEQLVLSNLLPLQRPAAAPSDVSTVPSDGNIPDPDDELFLDLTDLETLPSLQPTDAVEETRLLAETRSDSSPAMMHYCALMKGCVCKISCHSSIIIDISRHFFRLKELQRVRYMRSMLFALAAPPGATNDCFTGTASVSRKTRRRDSSDANSRTTTPYYIKGRTLCRPGFAAILQLAEKTVGRHAQSVAKSNEPEIYLTRHNTSRQGKQGVQKIVVHAFLKTFASNHSFECPRGRGSSDESPLRLLPSDFSRVSVHEVFLSQWKEIVSGLISLYPSFTEPLSPVSYSLFVRYWLQLMPTLRIAHSGSDFCDMCTTLKNTMKTVSESDARFISSKCFLEEHRQQAATEFQFYKKCQTDARIAPDNGTMHCVFDFAEKVLLPHLLKQPGQLHFITGLKFDLFGVSCSNVSKNYIFGLLEGHWPNEKTANAVIAMLHFVLEELKKSGRPTSSFKILTLHADNCSGQNKNRYLIWYLAWRFLVGLEEQITLNFLIVGQTKNVCDGSFGHVKRRFRSSDVHTPGEMMRLIQDSASTTTCVPATKVSWYGWKVYLAQFFTVLSRLKVSELHQFSFTSSSKGSVTTKALSSSENTVTFNLLKRNIVCSLVEQSWCQRDLRLHFKLLWSALDEVPSPKDGTRKQ